MNKMFNPGYDQSDSSFEAFLEAIQEEFPELRAESLSEFFESLPLEKDPWTIDDIRRGDILIRRQYGCHERVWFGVIMGVHNKQAWVHTRNGFRKVRLSKDDQRLDWEIKIIRPEYASSTEPLDPEIKEQPLYPLIKAQPIYPDFSEALQAEDVTSLPAAVVISKQADVFSEANGATKISTLSKDTSIIKVVEKKEVNGKWWYKIEYVVNSKNVQGWSLSADILEIANPDTFTFLSPGGSGSGSSFQELKDAIDKNKLLPSIARSINLMNYSILPGDPNLPDFIRKSFYHALVSAKGDFKKAALIITAAVRAFKEISSRGKFAWVQSKFPGKPKFSYDYYRDKIWHFFWNAYEIFTGTGPTYLDFKGVMYELKTREKPIRSLLTLDPLEKDAKEDIIFNRGGVKYAEWVNRNEDTVYKYHIKTVIDGLFAAVEQDSETQKLPFEKKKELVLKVFEANEDTITTEILKNSYSDFAEYAGKAVENVLAAIDKMNKGAGAEEWEEGENVPKKINEYNPAKPGTLVINMIEFETGITGIKNYKDWKTDRSVMHNKKVKPYRDPSVIKHLVLHETAADVGDGYNEANNETAHLSVKKDATILQFNDLVELEYHGNAMNETSIGIEFVNRGWLSASTDKGGEGIRVTKADLLTDDQKEKYKESKGYLWAFWGFGFNIYRLPTSLDQLEKEVELVKWITDDLQAEVQKIKGISIYNMFPWIDQEWLQLVSYEEVKDAWTFRADDIPPEAARTVKNLFVMTTGFEFLEPAKVKDKPGIISHNAFYEGHSDGSFLSLYTWLRLKKGKDKTQAYEIAKKLMKDHFITVSLKSNKKRKIILLKVDDGNLV